MKAKFFSFLVRSLLGAPSFPVITFPIDRQDLK